MPGLILALGAAFAMLGTAVESVWHLKHTPRISDAAISRQADACLAAGLNVPACLDELKRPGSALAVSISNTTCKENP